MSIEQNIAAVLPNLKSFALSLSKDPTVADDLVQETCVKALANRNSFENGTNLRAWLMTILRNTYVSLLRKNKASKPADFEAALNEMRAPDNPEWNVRMKDLERAWLELPAHQIDTLMLVVFDGLSYDDAAETLGISVGTVKSRVNRARKTLAAALGEESTQSACDVG